MFLFIFFYILLQRNDIAMAITKFDQFDFLIDIVPRDDLKPPKRQVTVSVKLLFWRWSENIWKRWQCRDAVNILDWKLGFCQCGLSVGCLHHLIATNHQQKPYCQHALIFAVKMKFLTSTLTQPMENTACWLWPLSESNGNVNLLSCRLSPGM